jgi:hypothetical protein
MSDGVIIGIPEIAEFCGVTKERLRIWIADSQDFPAKRDGRNGAWISTRRALLRWLDAYVSGRTVSGKTSLLKNSGENKKKKRKILKKFYALRQKLQTNNPSPLWVDVAAKEDF